MGLPTFVCLAFIPAFSQYDNFRPLLSPAFREADWRFSFSSAGSLFSRICFHFVPGTYLPPELNHLGTNSSDDKEDQGRFSCLNCKWTIGFRSI
jgi:hypothetical protein